MTGLSINTAKYSNKGLTFCFYVSGHGKYSGHCLEDVEI